MRHIIKLLQDVYSYMKEDKWEAFKDFIMALVIFCFMYLLLHL